MMDTIFSIRLRVAREIRGYSLEKLASLVKLRVTKQSLSRYETGVMKPKKAMLDSIAEALEISPEYFDGGGVQFNQAMLRTSAKGLIPEDCMEKIESVLSYCVERYIRKCYVLDEMLNFSNPLYNRVVKSFEETINAADYLRQEWRCGDGAIPSIIRLLERKGVLIFNTELPDCLMGLSTWANGTYPVILIDSRPKKTTVERLRFTVAHELAHLLLTFEEGVNIEKCCDKFAGSFLLPSNTLKEEVGKQREKLYLEELIDLRETYGVSIAPLIHEAYDLSIISREHYDWWYDEIIKSNIRETGWGEYKFPEILSKERRMDIRIDNI